MIKKKIKFDIYKENEIMRMIIKNENKEKLTDIDKMDEKYYLKYINAKYGVNYKDMKELIDDIFRCESNETF